jgi:hypothetical protein
MTLTSRTVEAITMSTIFARIAGNWSLLRTVFFESGCERQAATLKLYACIAMELWKFNNPGGETEER